MNFSVSNLAWSYEDKEAFEILKNNSINLLELSLTKQFGPWESINSNRLKIFSEEMFHEHGFQICSLQSLFFQKQMNLFFNPLEVYEHFKKVIEYSEALGCKYLVFGSPEIRKTNGKTTEECDDIFLNLFDLISRLNPDIKIGIETNPKDYGCEYLTSYQECVKITNLLSRNNICFHMDTACLFLNNENIINIYEREKKALEHIHISVERLGSISEDQRIEKFLKHLSNEGDKTINFNISIEMFKRSKFELLKSIRFLKDNFDG